MKAILVIMASKLGTPGLLGIPDNKADAVSLSNILNIVYQIAAIIAVIVIVVAGIRYSVSSGDAKSVAESKNAIIYALIGLVVVAAAFAITNTAMKFL